MKKLKLKIKSIPKKYYWNFFLSLVLFYFILTYSVVNSETISDQVNIILEGGSLFAKTATYSALHLNKTNVGYDKETYEIELLIFTQINKLRFDSGLDKLKWDPLLAQIARKHSLDMATNTYLNHTNLNGLNPTQRADKANFNTRLETKDLIIIGIGENIGFMPKGVVKDVGVIITTNDVASAMVLEWMRSEGHKENILKEDYIFTGIGVVYDGKENYYLTQNFQ